MTATTVKSTKITNLLDTTPAVFEPPRKQGGRLRVVVDTVEAATTSLDETGDIILMLPLPSNAALLSLKIYNDDLDSGGTSGAVDVGLYNGPRSFVDATAGAKAAYAVLDADAFASAITTLTAVNTLGVEIRFESASASVGDIALAGSRLFEIAGLATDPHSLFVVGVTVTTQMTTPVAGTITLIATYAVD